MSVEAAPELALGLVVEASSSNVETTTTSNDAAIASAIAMAEKMTISDDGAQVVVAPDEESDYDINIVQDKKKVVEPLEQQTQPAVSDFTEISAHERLYAKGKEKNTQVRLTAAQKKAEENPTPTKTVRRARAPGSRLSMGSMQSPNGLYERSVQQQRERAQQRLELQASEIPSFQPNRVTKSTDAATSTNHNMKAQDPGPVWKRLYKDGAKQKAMAIQKTQEKAEAEAASLNVSAKVATALAPGEVPRWQKLYEEGSKKRLATGSKSSTTPPRPKASSTRNVVSGSRIDQLHRSGTNNNRRQSALPRDNRHRVDDEEVATHCTFRPTLVSSQQKTKRSSVAGSSLASGSIAGTHMSFASSNAGRDPDPLIGKSLEVELDGHAPVDAETEATSPTDIATFATMESSEEEDANVMANDESGPIAVA
jgi:hypothetical protein